MVDSTAKQSTKTDLNVRAESTRRVNRRQLLAGSAAVVAGAALGGNAAASGGTKPASFNILRQAKAQLVFTYWGSPQEKQAVANMTDGFNKQNPNIEVRAQ